MTSGPDVHLRCPVLAAVLAASTLLVSCGLGPEPNATRTRESSPEPSTSNVPSTPSPSRPAGPYEILRVPEKEVVSYTLDAELGYDFLLHRLAAWGPRIVFDGAFNEHRRNLYAVDLVEQTLSIVATVPKSEWLWTPDISGTWVIWTEFEFDNPDAARPGASHWRIVAQDLTTNGAVVIDTGVHTRLVAGGAAPPTAKVDGDLVAYGIEAPRPGHPDAWAIVVKSLIDGAIVRTIETDRDLFRFDLANGNVVYSEGSTDTDLDFKYGTRLMVSTVERPEPYEVGRDAYEVAAGGDRFAWEWDAKAGAEGSPLPVAPVVMTATFGDPKVIQASVSVEAAPPQPGWGETLLGGLWPSASGDFVGWQDRQTNGIGGDVRTVAIFDANARRAYQIAPSPNPLFVQVQGGWLVWNSDVTPEGDEITHVLFGVPLDRLPNIPG